MLKCQPPAGADHLGGCRARRQGGADRRCRAAAIDRGRSSVPGDRRANQELSGIRRQREAWQWEASSDFARGVLGRAFERYWEHGAIHLAENRSRAKEELIKSWSAYRATQGAEKASLILARADVRELNLQARSILRERGELGQEVRVEVAR